MSVCGYAQSCVQAQMSEDDARYPASLCLSVVTGSLTEGGMCGQQAPVILLSLSPQYCDYRHRVCLAVVYVGTQSLKSGP